MEANVNVASRPGNFYAGRTKIVRLKWGIYFKIYIDKSTLLYCLKHDENTIIISWEITL